MINGYQIGKNGVMYLYFDFNYEFSRDDFSFKKMNIENIIKKFFIDNKIIFSGTIMLISGGILFGSINLNTPSFSSISINTPSIQSFSENEFSRKEINDFNNVSFNFDNVNSEKNISDSNDSVIVSNGSLDSNDSNYSGTYTDLSNVSSDSNYSDTYTDLSNVSSDSNYSETVNEIVNNNIVDNDIVDNNIYVSVRRGDGNVIQIELEDYVTGVVGAEMPASFNVEALKSQAIIARTYALKSNSIGKILSDNESTQSYKSNDQLMSLWGDSFYVYYDKIRDAVDSTKGMYLTYNGSYIEAVYHSTSNGHTEDASNVWGNSFPYLVSVDSIYDSENPSYSFNKSFTYSELSNILGYDVNSDTVFSIIDRTVGNRINRISVDDHVYSGIDFRKMLGLRSADFDILKNTDSVIFTTRGYGHGVGMSQYGANGMAKAGYSYIDILLHYYPGVIINYL